MNAGQGMDINWMPPGPVSARFFGDRRRHQAIMGPVGSGKTRTILTKLILMGAQQAPSLIDGVRRVRFMVLRDTYRQLWRTVIPTWWKVMPAPAKNSEWNSWEGGKDGPAKHHLKIGLGDKSVLDFELMFAALGDFDIEEFMRGLEVTGFYLNEADTLPFEVWYYANTRVGRYPDKEHGGPSWRGIICDLNAPDDENWTISMFRDLVTPSESLIEQQAEDMRQTLSRDDFGFHVQPAGMLEVAKGQYVENPKAENLHNLDEGYYPEQIKGQPRWLVRRMVLNKVGPTRAGKPVFEDEWNDDWHVADAPLQPVPGLPLILGADAGRTPAVVINQRLANGQWRVLREILGQGSAEVFGKLVNRVLQKEFPDYEIAGAWADPASDYAGDQSEKSWIKIMREVTKIRWRPAPGHNALGPRLEVQSHVLSESAGPGIPAFLVSPTCRALRKGYNSGYCFAKIKGPTGSRHDDKPSKNEYSHVQDAEQNALLGGGEYQAVTGRKRRREAAGRGLVQAATDFDVFG